MEEKDAFSDILLEQENDKKTSKFKKIALFVAIFMLIFIIVLVVMRLINPSEPQTDINKNTQTKQTSQPATQTKDDPLFKQVPIIKENDKKESFDELVKKLREKELKKEAEKKAEVKASEAKKETKTKAKTVAIKKIEVQKNVKPATTKTDKPKPIKKAQKSKKENKIPTIPTPKGFASSGNIFIQVLATSKPEPDTKFIKKIESKKYPYELFKTEVKGTSYLKILVGPYKSRSDAKKALPNVRKSLNPKAFIFIK